MHKLGVNRNHAEESRYLLINCHGMQERLHEAEDIRPATSQFEGASSLTNSKLQRINLEKISDFFSAARSKFSRIR
jgi:hypothetical protein